MDAKLIGWQTVGWVIGTIKILGSIVLITALVSVSCLFGWRLQGKVVMSVQSASMMPTFRAGDAVITEPVQLHSIRPGEVVSYHNPEQPKMLITHRVIHVDGRLGQLTTQGDALNIPDAPFADRLVVGKVTTILPDFGRLLNALRRPGGLLLLIYVPALLTVSAETYRWNRTCQTGYHLKRRS